MDNDLHNESENALVDEHVTLCADDAAEVDSLVDGTPEISNPARRARVQAWLDVVGRAPATAAPPDLLETTLACIAREPIPMTRGTREFETTPVRTLPWGRHIAELGAMAAAACVVLGVLIPGLRAARQDAQRTVCTANMGALGAAFNSYSALNNGALPTLGKSADGNWMPHDLNSLTGHSNAANMLPLVRLGLVDKQRLICAARGVTPTNFDPQLNEIPDGVRGYSYVNLFGAPPKWDQQRTTVVLADRNPLFVLGAPRDPFANSPNHGLRGTNVLTAAQTVEWVTTPNIGPRASNIWTIGGRTEYTGRETTLSPDEIFLSP